MVISRPKSKVYYCFIKLSGISFTKAYYSDAITDFLSRPAVISLTWLKMETPNTPLNAERSRRKAVSLVETNATPLLIGRKQNPEYTA